MAAYYAKKMKDKQAKAQKAYQSIVKAGQFFSDIQGNGVEGASDHN